jgi:diguanylate cyclase (GGDEF)-like protein
MTKATEHEPLYNSLWLVALVAGFAAIMLFIVASLGSSTQEQSIEQQIFHYHDASNELDLVTIDQIDEREWIESHHQNFGLSSASEWLKVDFPVSKSNQVLEIDYAMLDSVQLWFRTKNDDGSYQLIESYQLGDTLPFEQRPIIHDKFLVPLPAELAGMQLLLRTQSKGPVKVPLKLWLKTDYIVYTASHRLFMGLFFGYMITMGLINIFLYVSTRKITFITYAGYVFCFALLIASIHGLGYRFIWPENPWFQERSTAIFAFLTLSFILIFTAQILELKKLKFKYRIVFNFFSVVCVLGAIISFIAPYNIMIKIVLLMLLLVIPVILMVSLRLAYKGSAIAKFFSAAWMVLLFSGLAASVDNFHWLNLPLDSSYLLIVGAMTETLLLALAVATSYSVQRLEAKSAHLEAAKNELNAMQAQDELLTLQKQAQIDLEEQVRDRTKEFEEALAGLSKVNDELQGMSETDTLTGLSNRRFFENHIIAEAARSRREKQALAVALLDIDHFKQINDTYGHQCGDDCLVAFAKTMNKIVKRPGDLLSRYGGEEFVVLLPNTSLEGAKNLLEELRVAVEKLVIESQGHKIRLTVSAGVTSRVVGGEEEGNKMLAYADKLLYQAKKDGRNCVKSGNF